MSISSYLLSSILPTKLSQLFGYAPKHLPKFESFFEDVNSYSLYALIGHSAIRYFDGIGSVIGYGFDACAGFIPEGTINGGIKGVSSIFRDTDPARQALGYELAFFASQNIARSLDHGIHHLLGVESGAYIVRSAVLGAWFGRVLEVADPDGVVSIRLSDALGLNAPSAKFIGSITCATAGAVVGTVLSVYDWCTYIPPVEEKGYMEVAVDYANGAKDAAIDYASQIKDGASSFGQGFYGYCQDVYGHWVN